MREILFRGKRVDNGEWVEGYYYKAKYYRADKELCDYITIPHPNEENRGSEHFMVIPETVGQYTGLTDKNGTKIFEGDILKCKHDWQNWNTSLGNDEKDFFEQKIRNAYGKYIDKTASDIFGWRYHYFRNYAVEYYAPHGGFRIRNGGQFHDLTSNYILNRNLEIIGNIHDNPELFKGENPTHTAVSLIDDIKWAKKRHEEECKAQIAFKNENMMRDYEIRQWSKK